MERIKERRKEEQENKHKKTKNSQKIRSLETGTKSSIMVETIKKNNDSKKLKTVLQPFSVQVSQEAAPKKHLFELWTRQEAPHTSLYWLLFYFHFSLFFPCTVCCKKKKI